MVFRDKFFKNNVLMFLGACIGNLANLLCQIIIVKKLSVLSYGAFNSLLSVFMIISLPIGSISTMIVKFTSVYNNTGERKRADFFLSVLLRHMFFISLSFLMGYLIFGFNIKIYLQLDSILPVYFTGGMLFLSVISTLTQGGLQGLEKFVPLSLVGIFGGLLKLALISLFVSFGWDLLGALGGYLVQQIIVLLVSFLLLKEIFFERKQAVELDLKEKYKFIMPSLITLSCIAVLTNIDVIFVKHFFEPIKAGYYSIAQLIGKIVLFIPGAIYIVMFPATAGLHAQRKDSRDLLIRSLKYTTILCLLAVVIYNLFPNFILEVLTGKVKTEIIFLGRLFTIAMTFFSLLAVLLLYQLSISRFKFLKSLVLFSLLQILAILIFHTSLVQILLVLVLNSIILFIVNLRLAIKA